MNPLSRFTLFYSRNRKRLVKAIEKYEIEIVSGRFRSKVAIKEKRMIEKILEGTGFAYCSHNLSLYGSIINNHNKAFDRPLLIEEWKQIPLSLRDQFHRLELSEIPIALGEFPEWWRPERD